MVCVCMFCCREEQKKGKRRANIVAQEGQRDEHTPTDNDDDEDKQRFSMSSFAFTQQLGRALCVCIDTRVASVKSLGTRM